VFARQSAYESINGPFKRLQLSADIFFVRLKLIVAEIPRQSLADSIHQRQITHRIDKYLPIRVGYDFVFRCICGFQASFKRIEDVWRQFGSLNLSCRGSRGAKIFSNDKRAFAANGLAMTASREWIIPSAPHPVLLWNRRRGAETANRSQPC
jgi:hypothetical protein